MSAVAAAPPSAAAGTRIVLALGGNALIRRGQECNWATQARNVRHCVRAMQRAGLFDPGRPEQVILTHGNGPQVGDMAKRMAEEPLHELVACTQASIGHMLEQELRQWLPAQNPEIPEYDPRAARQLQVCSVVTHVAVNRRDPAFQNPAKFVGLVMNRDQASSAPKEWTVKQDGANWRRVVPSPEPHIILQLPTIERLLQPQPVVSPATGVTSWNKTMVICCGGGGIPVDAHSGEPLEAVVDKDKTSALLARRIRARRLVILTDVPRVWVSADAARRVLSDPQDPGKPAEDVEVAVAGDSRAGDGSPTPKPGCVELVQISVQRLQTLHRSGEFPEGSMGPKIEAVLDYMTGSVGDLEAAAVGSPEGQGSSEWIPRSAAIGRLDDLPEILAGRSGTHVFAGHMPPLRKSSWL